MTSPDQEAAAPARTATPAPPVPKAVPAAGPPAAIPTGFPEPAAPEPPRPRPADGKIRLAPAGFASLTVPPLGEGGETVVIGPEGTDVDEETAERAREAARLAGFTLREL